MEPPISAKGLPENSAVFQRNDKVRAEPFAAVELDLSLLWGDLPPEEPEEEEKDAGEG
jgi:hypothetical protein